MNPSASVIVTANRRVPLLGHALKSALAQTFTEFELIVVNDCPDDAKAIDALAAELSDHRLRIIHQDKTRGANAARNVGIRASTGDILAFLDDDDRWLPAKLERHLEAHAENPYFGIVYSDAWTVWLDLPLPGERWSPGPVPDDVVVAMSQELFNAGLPISTVRRECFTRCGLFDETIVSFQDWDMWFAIAHKYQFRHVPQVLTVIGRHLGSRTSQAIDLRAYGLQQVLRKWDGEVNASEIEPRFTRVTFYSGIQNAILKGERHDAIRLLRRMLPLLRPWQDRRLIIRILAMVIVGKKGYIWLRQRRRDRMTLSVLSGLQPIPASVSRNVADFESNDDARASHLAR